MHRYLVYNFYNAAQEKVKDVNSECGSESALSPSTEVSLMALRLLPVRLAQVSVESLVIKINKSSVVAMCALLDFIYTDDINLSMDISRFAISRIAKDEEDCPDHHPSKDHHSVV